MRQAGLVLAGYRPAGVRFDEEDRQIALEIAGRLSRACVAGGDFCEDGLSMMIERAIGEYASRDEHSRKGKRTRRHRPGRDCQMTLPFRAS